MKIGFVMDPIERINPVKDSTFAMLLEAQRRGHEIHYMTDSDLYVANHQPRAISRHLTLQDKTSDWFSKGPEEEIELARLDAVLMRKDPPFDMEYVMDTYVLDLAQSQGVLVINNPQALRDANEKFFTEFFPDLSPDSCVSRNPRFLKEFVLDHGKAVIKPMDGMGGASIFQTAADDPNLNVILETVTNNGQRTAIAQTYIEAISEGDKRILLVDGEAVPYALARIPAGDDFRGNLAKGGRGEGRPLTAQERHIARRVGPVLREKGILFAGIDVIGGYLTEINVTSPTCIRELDKQFGLNIAGQLFDAIEKRLQD